MDELISRQAAIDGILHLMPPNPNLDDGSAEQLNFSAWKCALTCAEASIKMMPSAQPKRKTGKWIRTDMTDIVDGKYINWAKWNCSECGVVKKIGWAKGVNFCPNCGADMRGVDDAAD